MQLGTQLAGKVAPPSQAAQYDVYCWAKDSAFDTQNLTRPNYMTQDLIALSVGASRFNCESSALAAEIARSSSVPSCTRGHPDLEEMTPAEAHCKSRPPGFHMHVEGSPRIFGFGSSFDVKPFVGGFSNRHSRGRVKELF